MSSIDYQTILAKRLATQKAVAQGEIEAPKGPLEIVCYPSPFLRGKSVDVEIIDDELRKFIEDMLETMLCEDGVGLAARQVNSKLNLFVMDPVQDGTTQPYVVINPQILAYSGYWKQEEGCLSIPEYRAEVERADTIDVQYLNMKGESCTERLEGFAAIVFQHEFDHLHGILFPDRTSRIKRADFLRKFGLEKTKFVKVTSLADRSQKNNSLQLQQES